MYTMNTNGFPVFIFFRPGSDLVQTVSLGQIRLLYFSFLTKYLLKVVESTYETMILILNRFPNHIISYIIKKSTTS